MREGFVVASCGENAWIDATSPVSATIVVSFLRASSCEAIVNSFGTKEQVGRASHFSDGDKRKRDRGGRPGRTFGCRVQIHFVLLVSRQGKCRLTKWYSPYPSKDKKKIVREVSQMCLSRPQKLCNFLEWKDQKIIFKR